MKPVPLLEIDQVTAAYGSIEVLHQVSLNVHAGEIVTLIGANGAGKSTLMMSIFGEPRIRSGQIRFAGENISHHPTYQISAHGIALVPEGRRVFAKMTIEDNLLMGAYSVKRDRSAAISEGLALAYENFPKLAQRSQQYAGTLSGGEQQMLAIARALMSRPKLLLLDEPSLGLAPIIVQQIFRNLETIASNGTTIFLVEQNAAKALRLASRAYVMVGGRITLSGSGRALLENPEVQAAYLGH